jgi:hypothetical protein
MFNFSVSPSQAFFIQQPRFALPPFTQSTQPGQAGTKQVEITILLLINSLGSPANA